MIIETKPPLRKESIDSSLDLSCIEEAMTVQMPSVKANPELTDTYGLDIALNFPSKLL
jgi:hypothetical protein